MAVPRNRQSNARKNKRRAHDALNKANTYSCPNCNAPKLAHMVCASCGFYGKRQVFETASES